MPAIRLADIPNAGPQALGPSGNLLAPQVAQLGRSAMMDPAALQAPARGMLTQTLELDAFSQEAKAAAKLGQSIQGIGDVAMQWGEKFAQAKDLADISRGETLLAIAAQKQKDDQLTYPVEKWGERLAINQAEAQKGLAEIKFSNNAAQRFSPYLLNWEEKTKVAMNGDARIKQLELSRTDIKANAIRLSAQGDFEGAITKMREGMKTGAFTSQEVDLFSAQLADNQVRAAEAMQTDQVTADLMTDYTVAKAKLGAYITKAGDAKDDSRIDGEYGQMPMSKVRRLMAQVDQQGRITEANNYRILAQAIDSDPPIVNANGIEIAITDKDKLNKALETFKVTGTKAKALLERMISDNVPYNAKSISEVTARLATYDPATDKDLGEYATLQNEIAANVPKNLRPLLNDRLAQAVKKFNADGTLKSATEKWQGDMIRHVLDLGKSGIMGDQGLDSDGKNIVDVKKNDAYWQNVYKVQQGMEDWFRNPANKDKTPADAQAFRDSLIKSGIEASAKKDKQANQKMDRGYVDSISAGAYGAPTPKPTPPPSDQYIQQGKETEKPAAHGKVTSYNFPNDPYSDSNSRKWIGAWNNQLSETSLAISPDIERKFKAAGIKQGDPVRLTLADGSTVVRTWDDRTSQKLSGRFDFHSPGGKQKKDGMAVVDFRKAEPA